MNSAVKKLDRRAPVAPLPDPSMGTTCMWLTYDSHTLPVNCAMVTFDGGSPT